MPLLKRELGGFSRARAPEACVASIGNFDGLHLGHQQLLQALQHAGAARNLPTLLMSFEPLSHEYFRRPAAYRIMGWRDKLQQLHTLGIDYVLTLSFNRRLSLMPAGTFLAKYLLGLRVRELIVGHDFRFGTKRSGDISKLKAYAAEQGIGLQVIEPVLSSAQQRLSSSALRVKLEEGDLGAAAAMLGRNYRLLGKVEPGRQLGRSLGFPTANLRLSNSNPALRGVFAARARLTGGFNDGLDDYLAAVNIGWRPSIAGGDKALSCEAHLLDFDQDIYGRWLQLEFTTFVRPELKFANLEQLRQQIALDVAAVRRG